MTRLAKRPAELAALLGCGWGGFGSTGQGRGGVRKMQPRRPLLETAEAGLVGRGLHRPADPTDGYASSAMGQGRASKSYNCRLWLRARLLNVKRMRNLPKKLVFSN